MSETDAPVVPFVAAENVGNSSDTLLSIAGLPSVTSVEEIPPARFFDRFAADQEWFSTEQKETAERFRRLNELLTGSLGGLRGYRFGTIKIEIFIAGNDENGLLTGVRTQAVET